MSKPWEVYIAKLVEGAELVASRETEGMFRGIARDTQRIVGQAEFAKLDLRKPAVAIAAGALVIGVAGGVAIAKNAPKIKRVWNDQVMTKAASVVDLVAQKAGVSTPDPTVSGAQGFRDAADEAVDDVSTGSPDRRKQRNFIVVLMGASILAEQARSFSDPDVRGEKNLEQLTAAMARLSSETVTHILNAMLRADPTLLDDGSRDIFVKIFKGGYMDGEDYVPVLNETIRDVLRLPQADPLPARDDSDETSAS